jgi:hypothetical protein
VTTRNRFRGTACVESLYPLRPPELSATWGRARQRNGGPDIRDCLKNLEATEIVARIPSPCVPLPEGERNVKPRQLCSLSPWERVGVRVRKRITSSIVARFGPYSKFWDSFILPVIQRQAGCLSHQSFPSPPSHCQFRGLLSALAIYGPLLPLPSVIS